MIMLCLNWCEWCIFTLHILLWFEQEGLKSQEVGSMIVAEVARQLQPRYHFCTAEGAFYERLPYRYDWLKLLY